MNTDDLRCFLSAFIRVPWGTHWIRIARYCVLPYWWSTSPPDCSQSPEIDDKYGDHLPEATRENVSSNQTLFCRVAAALCGHVPTKSIGCRILSRPEVDKWEKQAMSLRLRRY